MNSTETMFFVNAVLIGSILILGILVVAIVAFVISTYRRVTRRKLYIPIEAKVVHVIHDESFFGDSSKAFVTYDVHGYRIQHRLSVTKSVGWCADRSKRLELLVDPKYPKHAVIDEAYKQIAKTTPAPPPPSLIRRCLASSSIVLDPFSQLDTFSNGPTRVFFLGLSLVLIVAGILQVCFGYHLAPNGIITSQPLSLDAWFWGAFWLAPGAIGVVVLQFSAKLPKSVLTEWGKPTHEKPVSRWRLVLGSLAALTTLLIIIGVSARTIQWFAANARFVSEPFQTSTRDRPTSPPRSTNTLAVEKVERLLELDRRIKALPPRADLLTDRPAPEVERLLKEPLELTEEQRRILASPPITNSLGMKLKMLPHGTYVMGSSAVKFKATLHIVNLSQAFYLSVTEVTQEQYERVMGTNPSQFQGNSNPVESVSWDDAVEFCLKLSQLPEEQARGRVYRLPTEAEWEYACRAGTTTEYSFGNDESKLGEHDWHQANSDKRTGPVGKKTPNYWGIYDLHGNVREWCQDGYRDFSKESVTDPMGEPVESGRIVRGGDWDSEATFCRSAVRQGRAPSIRFSTIGFRVAMSTSRITDPPVQSQSP
jgi:formylglycine-generating enzyme required for sulfatase activity